FVGCISGVKYTDSSGHFTSAVLKNTSGTTADCKRACTRHYEFVIKCKHGQRCGQKITECDCLETGYEGQDCTRASTSVWLNGTGYMKYNLTKDTKNPIPLTNNIGFRFRTSSPEGVLLHTGVGKHFLVLELLAGNIVLKLDLGKDSSPSTIVTENNTDPSLVYGNQQGSARHHGVPSWVITITVVAAVISIFITITIVYRWNTRYSGSFSTASATLKTDPPEPWPDPPPRTKPILTSTVPLRIEQPTIYVTAYDKV
ncbi:hypothetical protein QZH41_014197, partial [Actinostola sp. cb2023]